MKFRYGPSGKPGKVPEYQFSNSSGNQIINEKYLIFVLAYAIYRQDLVFISGQVVGNIVYIRNLVLIHRTDQSKGQPRPQA